MFIWLKGIALKKFQIWPTNCPCFKSEPQFRFNNYRSLNPLVLTVLDQATVLDFHFGPYLIDEQFLGNCIWTGKPNKYTIRPFIVLNIISGFCREIWNVLFLITLYFPMVDCNWLIEMWRKKSWKFQGENCTKQSFVARSTFQVPLCKSLSWRL